MRTLRLSLGAVILALLGGPVAVVGQSEEPPDPMSTPPASPPVVSPSPAVASPSPLASPMSFASDTYGYSLSVPLGWTTVQATEVWDGQGAPSHEQPVADQLVGPGPASAWAYAATTASDLAVYAEETIAATNADHGDTCPSTPEVQEPIDIGGETGTLLSWDCGILINLAVTVHDGIGYLFGFRDPAIHAATDEADRVIFEQLLASVRFPE